MNLRNVIAGTLISLGSLASFSAPVAPQFSNGSEEHWYYIVFSAGEAVLSNQGKGLNAVTAAADATKPAQLWKFTGTADNFKIVNKRYGEYVLMKGFVNATDTPESASEFKLVPSSNNTFADSWEIEYLGADAPDNHWHQWYKTGSGVNIGLSAPGASNNAVTFLAESDLPAIPALTKLKEFAVNPNENYTPEHRHTLWYNAPAEATGVGDPWMEYALPIGNGQFGAMIFGGVAQDHIQFNEKTLWNGSTTTRGNYMNFGDVYVEDISGMFGESADKAVGNYIRNLDMTEGKANVYFTSTDGSVQFNREYIASNPDNVVAMHYAASEGGKISLRIRLFNGVKLGMLKPEYKDGSVTIAGLLDYIHFKAVLKAVPTGGTMTTLDDCIEIKDADEVMLVLGGATNYDIHSANYLGSYEAMYQKVDADVNAAAAKGWSSLVDAHIADFGNLFGRAEFNIDAAANTLTVNKMVSQYNSNRNNSRTRPTNLMLEELYYAFGRYLLISSSRGMDLPANLQGIWNNSNNPAWQCDIHSNINVQMNYWPAEITNLSELHAPYLNYIYSMAIDHKEWQDYARRSGQSEGWTCFTQNNIFGHSDYAENYVIANAWYATHLWQHYAYTLDLEFLNMKALPVMVSCCKFWLERLVKDDDGTWVAPKEWSPEHGPAEEDATAHAQQILYELFRETIEAINILESVNYHVDLSLLDPDFIAELKKKFANLDKGLATEEYTGVWGAESNGIKTGDLLLREWKQSTYDVGEKEHRHQSHLMALYPFGNITPESEWFEPAVNSLRQRGDVSTGWALAWRLALWARALDGEHASKIITSALRHASSYGQSNGAGGIYYNLFDSHSPFQIDGNFGYTTGVTEMLLQSYGGKIRLLPALSPYWVAGSIRGIKAEGNFEVDQVWKDSKLTEAVIKAGSGGECVLNYSNIADADVKDENGNDVSFTKIDANNIKLVTEKGSAYYLTFGDNSGVAEIADAEMVILVDNKVATVAMPDVRIDAYDIAGRLVASSSDSVLDLSNLTAGAVILKAKAGNKTAVKKVMVK
ncbi:MAG: glycoside hydrolase family 95 protein [Muribaculaceae bacterium]|nr:glycoside hydrolase family 95 protein [Muribaculaceae bacterium]